MKPFQTTTLRSGNEALAAVIHSAPIKKVQFLYRDPMAAFVSVAGTFNNWNPEQTPMVRDKRGVWRTSLLVPRGRHEYRFIVDGRWINDPREEDSVPNIYGGTNSVFTA